MARWRTLTVLILTATAVYLYAYPTASIFYFGNVVLHAGLGLVAALGLLVFLFRGVRQESGLAQTGWYLLTVGAVLGVALLKLGTPHRLKYWLYAHIGFCVIGVVLLASGWLAKAKFLGEGVLANFARVAVIALLAAGIASLGWWTRNVAWKSQYLVENPPIAPASMEEEGDGAHGKFFPSSVQTTDGNYIPSDYFMQSKACERCHGDIYKQWESSAHHFSSFNNQWYRKSIEYMQDVSGVQPSKWCAGCHDPALLFSGMMDRPIAENVHKPEAQAGLSCLMCHSIVKVKSTMGQGDFTLEYPKLHALAASQNPLVRGLHDFMVRLNPEPHRRVFLKPFMTEQVPEFCSGCHKVHLDVPVNHYRWIRGFNEYDNWQASGVSGQGARAFYYPATSMMCADCHMPLVPSKDEGNRDGYVHSHRFPGANTAVPTANEDPAQLQASLKFLQDKQLSVDIFAISPVSGRSDEGASVAVPKQEMSTAFAVGEEADLNLPRGPAGEARAVTAPIERTNAAVRRGDDVLVDVVVRTRKVGHFFPGGTIDAFDVWLELQATDEKGQTIFWSGKVEDDGKGPVDASAHFYKSLMIDSHGNPINKRNAWANRAVVYVRLIPPGAADTVHFRMHIPENAGERITLHSKLNYRKFQWWNTRFSFAGQQESSKDNPMVTPDYDDRSLTYTTDFSDVSAKIKGIPDLPTIVVAQDTKTLRVLPKGSALPAAEIVWAKDDWTRWNDYGIGLFLQGDLKAAEQAFGVIATNDPENPDGWTNVGRVRVQEGNLEGGKAVLQQALALKPGLPRANFFYGRLLKEEGKYEEATKVLEDVLAQFPRDRVVHNELGRVLFLQKKYAEAVAEFQKTLAIDPEDLQANYNLMLCYTGLGNEAKANQHKERYLRFKADEAAQTLTGAYRQNHPEDNNERQLVHVHSTAPPDTKTDVKTGKSKAGAKTGTTSASQAGAGR